MTTGNNRNFDDFSNSGRFKYNPFKKELQTSKYVLALIFIVIAVILLTIFWWWPSWFADISLQQQLYLNKADSDFISVYFLDFWSTNFFFNKTALIGAFMGSIIMSIPPDRTLITVIGTRLRFGKPSYLKALIFWWTIGFVIFYLAGFLLNFNGNSFSWAAYLIEQGELNLSETLLFDAFNVLFDPLNKDFITIFLYSSLILPLISFVMILLILRAGLNVLKNVYLRRNDFYALSNVFIILGLAFGLWFFNTPTQSLDGIGLIQIWAILIGFISFNLLGILLYIFSRYIYSRDTTNYLITPTYLKKIGIVGFLVVIILVVPLFISIGPAININNTSVWIEQQWIKKYQREVEWTTDTAGLTIFEERDIENFTLSTTTADEDMINQIRQYDQTCAVQYLAASIGTTFEGLADSDIVYIRNLEGEYSEYWVAPKTIKFTQITGDPVQRSTEFFDHVEGFLAMDTNTGELVSNIEDTFNISQDYPIFFGESESERYLAQTIGTTYQESVLGAFDSDVLLGTEWFDPDRYDFRYSSEPDGTLSGLENFWKKVNLGLFAYAFDPSNTFLKNRNVKSRVSGILLPNLKIDNDPYLIFNIDKGELYYAASIYTDIPIGSYAKYPISRFLGICLIDVLSGDLDFYKNPSLATTSDPTYPLWQNYLSAYDWQDAPLWLKEQLRYPEDLFELQLRANYIYHVKTPGTWKSEADFHERPINGDLFYIETDIGDGVEYVGLDLVEYKGDSANVLAGMYIIRHGDNFGDAIFYHTRNVETNLLGPYTANQTYVTEATQELSLIAGARNGNILLYPLDGTLYYYIPTYSTAGTLQQLKQVGFVEPFTRTVLYGDDANSTWNDYKAPEVPVSNVTLDYDFQIGTEIDYPDSPVNFQITIQNLDLNYSAPGLDIVVNLTLYTSTTNNVDYTIILPPSALPLENSTYTFLIDSESYTAVNYTIVDTTLYFGEGIVLNGYINTSINNINIYAIWNLYVDGEIEYQSPAIRINVF